MWCSIAHYVVVLLSSLYFLNPVVKFQEEFKYLKLGEEQNKTKKQKMNEFFSGNTPQVSVLSKLFEKSHFHSKHSMVLLSSSSWKDEQVFEILENLWALWKITSRKSVLEPAQRNWQ